jgi:hypothetical protein
MSPHKSPLERLLATLADFEQHATPAEKKAAILPLQRLSRKLEIRSLELLEQRLLLTRAEGSRDKITLRDLADFSQFPEIVEWSFSILHPKPRTPGGLGISL